MINFVVHEGAYENMPPSMWVSSFPTEEEFLMDFLNVDEEGIENALVEYEEQNLDPHVMVINVDTEEVIIGEI
jgi:hypothetical protein